MFPRALWLRNLTLRERSTLSATFLGWMLDGMDVMIYSFVAPSLLDLWHISQTQAGLLLTSSLIVSSFGGWMAGLAADRYGRVRILQLTILWFALFSFLSGFTQSFWQLLVVRSLQGLGVGGEWTVGSVLMGETIRSEYRGRCVGTVQSGWALGWGIAALCHGIFSSLLPHTVAWRAMFWIGIAPALVVSYVRKHVPEPAIYRCSHKKHAGERRLLTIFTGHLLPRTLLASLVAFGAQGAYYAVTTWLPRYLVSVRRLSILNTTAYLSVVIIGSFVGYLTSATLTDILGRRRTLIVFAICSFLTVWSYTELPITNTVMLPLGFPLGFFLSGTFSPLGSFFTELFPTSVRGSAQGFTYNFGRAAGSVLPAWVGHLSSIHGANGLGRAIAICSASAYAAMIVGALLLPETRGKPLPPAI
jgi:MFS family permease